MTTNISNELSQYTGKSGLCYQITLPCKENKNHLSTTDNWANTVPNYGYCWITLTKEQMDKIVIDYIQFRLLGQKQ